MTLKAPLGGAASEYFKFTHRAKVLVEYKARIENAPGQKGVSVADFSLEDAGVRGEACDDANQARELQLRVRYQPSGLGTKEQPSVAAMLVISGPGGGEYKAMITGFAQPPQPQGPYEVGNGKMTAIEFRNPFDKATEFTLQVDNPCFMVPARAQMVDPGAKMTIQVTFK